MGGNISSLKSVFILVVWDWVRVVLRAYYAMISPRNQFPHPRRVIDDNCTTRPKANCPKICRDWVLINFGSGLDFVRYATVRATRSQTWEASASSLQTWRSLLRHRRVPKKRILLKHSLTRTRKFEVREFFRLKRANKTGAHLWRADQIRKYGDQLLEQLMAAIKRWNGS